MSLPAFATALLAARILCWPETADAQELRFNGVPFDTREGEVLLAPGASNRLEISRSREVDPGEALKVTWELRTGDGRRRSGTDRIASGASRTVCELGPLAAPPVYEFEAGEVFQRGYRLTVRLSDSTGRSVRSWSFYQEHGKTPSEVQQGMGEVEPLAQRIRLVSGENQRLVYNPRFGALAPLSLRLGESVLTSQDDLEIRAKLNTGEVPEQMRCVLRVAAADGKELWRKEVDLRKGAEWSIYRVDASSWSAGDYRVDLWPIVEGRTWDEGPRLRYRRRTPSGKELLVSPVAPWQLERDASRAEIVVREFQAPPSVLRSATKGHYAVFATYRGEGGLIQVGRQGLIRGVALSNLSNEVFVEAADLTGEEILIHPSRDPKSQLVSVRLVPVTAASARRLAHTLANPPMPLYSVNDWAEYFGMSWSRLLPDQFTSIVCVQAEFGFRTVGWSVGRSWVEYPSKLPAARVFPCVPYDRAKVKDPYDYGPRIVMMNEHDPLAGAYAGGKHCQTQVWPWLGMHRHYGVNSYGGIFSCPFYREHPEWRQVSKDGKPSGLSFYYPEVRKERVDILVEVAERGADGLFVGCDRQVPMLRYEPRMVEEFRTKTGIDATAIDASGGPAYEKWIRFRAAFFTETLRELKRRLGPVRTGRNARIPVGVRIPAGGLFLNLAQGLDVETWCREGLVDLIDLDPLEEAPGEGSQDVRPYLALGRKHGIPVIGGVGSTAFRDLRVFGLRTWQYSVITAGLKRAQGLHRAGVDGVNTFETEVLTWTDPVRFAVALYGHPAELDRFLEESNIEAVYPVDASNAAAGHDNHSVWRPGWTWSMHGFGARSF